MAGRFWAIPAFGQVSLDATTIGLKRAVLSNATSDAIHMKADLVLDNAGFVLARIHGFRAEVAVSGGQPFGWFAFPDTQVAGSGPTAMTLDTNLHVTDANGFAAALSQVLQGGPCEWDISGSPKVSAMGASMHLRMKKPMMLPITLLEQMRSFNIDVALGSDRELFSTADLSFFSGSSLEIANLGPLTFSLHPMDELGAPQGDVQLGHLIVRNFAVARGFNILGNTSIVLEKTNSSEPYLAAFLGTWASGLEQIVAIQGPTRPQFSFLENITTQTVVVAGVTKGLVKSAYVSGFDSLQGHSLHGQPCSLLESSDCLKGPVVTMQNTLHHTIKLTDISLDANLLEDLAYEAVIHTLPIFPKKVSCRKGSRLSRLSSVPGMWAYLNASRASDASVLVPGVPPDGESVLTSRLLFHHDSACGRLFGQKARSEHHFDFFQWQSHIMGGQLQYQYYAYTERHPHQLCQRRAEFPHWSR
eukprot:CAMPEP_0115540212 /NCGR_PEP_ID=MMETSP0271-20121206/89809_1 /TAXON_ID=71861 /ORGANISM="Scrippsiella trochoidea, Strain CCMP3099" /LENGTH=472 /DNA_ID=CAMNT_0002973195 /DNA_START=71 /DNA_END=1485 /DNA_ORIENTATION=+